MPRPSPHDGIFDGALVIVLEQGVRFLSDYLAGDLYYAVDRPEHNLDRCRVQFQMVRSMEAQADAMEAVVREIRR